MLIKKERIPVVHIILIGLWPSFLKVMLYRMLGYRIGKNVSLSLGSVVIGKDVEIADHVKIGFFSIVRGKSVTIKRFVKIGAMSVIDTEKIFIDEDARISEQVYIGGMKTPQSELRLGKRTTVMQMSYLNPTLPIIVGDDSGIGGHCLLFTHGSWNDQLEGFPVKFAPITIGKKVWLPWRVFLTPGVTIGDNAVIGAGSLVTSDVPANSLAAGHPAKVLKREYPEKPSLKNRQFIIEQVFTDFFEYLSYHGLTVNKESLENGFTAKITGKGKTTGLTYCTVADPAISASHTDHVLIIYECDREEMIRLQKQKWSMVISPGNRLRIGTSDTGEEIVAFFSRYGTRFERLD